jgi:hypothetical protein
VAHGDVDRVAGQHLARDVDEDAVAQVDRVVEADERRRGPVAPGEKGEDALAPTDEFA